MKLFSLVTLCIIVLSGCQTVQTVFKNSQPNFVATQSSLSPYFIQASPNSNTEECKSVISSAEQLNLAPPVFAINDSNNYRISNQHNLFTTTLGTLATAAFVTQSELLTAKAFDQLYLWAEKGALLRTTQESTGAWNCAHGCDWEQALKKDTYHDIQIVSDVLGVVLNSYDMIRPYAEGQGQRNKVVKSWMADLKKWADIYWKENDGKPAWKKGAWANLEGSTVQLRYAAHNHDQQSWNRYLNKVLYRIELNTDSSGAILPNAKRGDRGYHYHLEGMNDIIIALEILEAQGFSVWEGDIGAQMHKAVSYTVDVFEDERIIWPFSTQRYNNPGTGKNIEPDKLFKIEHNSWLYIYSSRFPDHPNTARLREHDILYRARNRPDRWFGLEASCLFFVETVGPNGRTPSQVIALLDGDGDGRLSNSEFKDRTENFSRVDANNDGFLEKQEFETHYRRLADRYRR